ncbi:putative gag-pol protein [Trichonephila clavipes]|nr:putative gag-pol protein [Trichonephila clavipes]
MPHLNSYDILTSLTNTQVQCNIYQAPPAIYYAVIATAQDSDQELTKLASRSNYNLKFDKLPVIGSEYMVTCTQFESELFYELSKLLGFKRKRITIYHPQANGLVERWHRTLKATIMCHSDATSHQFLPNILLGLRTTIHEDLKATSTELVFGENLRLPGHFLHDSKLAFPSSLTQQLRNTFTDLRPVLPAHHKKQKPLIFCDLATCTHVFLSVLIPSEFH